MSSGSFAKKRLYPVAFMLAVTLVFISVTSVVYTFTGERIELNERLRLKQAVLYAAGVELPPDPSAIEKIFDGRVTGVKGDGGDVRYYEIRAEGSEEIEAYVVIYVGKGLWGEITAGVGFDASLESCRGLEIIEQKQALIEAELRKVLQRVNLFEKVVIPEARDNIRRIRIALGDRLTAAVARAKIAKEKVQERERGNRQEALSA